jgi:WD40 repeat protein/serine/threonine protein kinase
MTSKKNPEEIFTEAVEISDPAQQEKYLDEICAGDEKLRAEVDALLKWHKEAGDFLEVPDDDPNSTLETSASPECSGTVIGRYKLLQKIGEGGMATVYMAEQKQPIRRRVAFKIIKLGMDTKQVIARFEAERQALAMMDHSNIAKVFDAGTTDTGRPYFVMELVRGLPITKFCDSNHLTTRERLDLFISVCQAVQHAHQRGVIHRDIKPSNVLVTLHDGQPVPKVIDFGVAKAVNQQLTEKTVFTRYSQMIGTPEYMSPEQAEMSGLDIDTRTDVFSLGVLIYELLTGTTPFDQEYLLSKGYGEMQRIIREEEPVRPSTKISTLGEALTDVAKHRRTSPELLCKLIRTDLDWIVMKTLEKDRDRRYESVSEFAADIKRHLNNESVLAGRPSSVYRIQKFFKRNKLLVTSATAIAMILVFATTVSLWQMVRANRAADQLGLERDRAVKAEQSARAAETEARTAQETAAKERDHAKASERSARLNLYAADMKAVQENIDNGNLGAAQKLLKAHQEYVGEDDIRGWEWRYLWKRAQGDHQQRFAGHEDCVNCVAFSPDGELIASGSKDQSIIVRDKEGKILAGRVTGSEVNSISFSKDGIYLAASNNKGGVLLWDVGSFNLVKQFAEQEDDCAYVSFSPTDPVLAMAYGSGRVKLWDYTTKSEGTWLPQSLESDPEKKDSEEEDFWSSVAAFSNDGEYLATFAPATGRYDIWEIENLQRIASLKDFEGRSYAEGHVSFIPGTSTVFLGDRGNGSFLWDFESGNVTMPISETEGRAIARAVFTSDGTMMATAGFDHTVRLWEIAGTAVQEKTRLYGHTNEVWAIAITPDEMELATGGVDSDVLIWSAKPHENTESIKKTFFACKPCFSGDGQLVAVAGGIFPFLNTLIYDLEAACFLKTEIAGYPVDFSDDATEIIVVRGDFESIGLVSWNLTKSRTSWESDPWPIHGMPTSLPTISRARKLWACAWEDNSVIVGNYANRTMLGAWKSQEGRVETIAFSPDGRLILTADRADATSGSVIVWSCSDPIVPKMCYEITEHRYHVCSAAFSFDGEILATGDFESRILLTDVATGAVRQELVGQKQMVMGLAFAPDGKTLVSAHGDGTIRFWHVATGRELAKIQLGDRAWSVALSPDGNALATMTGGPFALVPEELHVWQVPSFEEITRREIKLQEQSKQ